MIKVKTRCIQEQAVQCGHGPKAAIIYGIPTILFQLSFLYFVFFKKIIYIYVYVDIYVYVYTHKNAYP